ncbi:MAG: hypothetical protein LWW85_14025 [Marinilabiliales bacterium]|nr:hypothetical protein [Marinilabiliales bacterium]
MKPRFRNYLDRQDAMPVLPGLPPTLARKGIFVTIPCYDEPDLITTLDSLAACTPPKTEVTVIVAVNSPTGASPSVLQANLSTLDAVDHWMAAHPTLFFTLRMLHIPDLPAKWAGVGWARKIAMDDAIRSLDRAGADEGILVSFDADSTVTSNYLTAIESAFAAHPKWNFATLRFAHPLSGVGLSPSMQEGIVRYELYLRYLKNAMEWSGYPHSIHTIGSAFAVKASAYVKQGGMNRRQAGEDFHFLHKLVPLGHYGEIPDATVIPSPRVSHRVPFGTGAALKKWAEGDRELITVYPLHRFRTLKPLLENPDRYFSPDAFHADLLFEDLDCGLRQFLQKSEMSDKLSELRSNCADAPSFRKRFYHLLSAFWIIQYLNFCESLPDGKGDLIEESILLLKERSLFPDVPSDPMQLLRHFRDLDDMTDGGN